jgi:hypothetical protein
MNKVFASVLRVAGLATVLSACATGPQTYPGPKLPDDQVSTIIVQEHFGWDTSLSLDMVDGKNVGVLESLVRVYNDQEFSLLPGQHQLMFSAGPHLDFHASMTTLPGHRYRITRLGHAQLVESDETTGIKMIYSPVPAITRASSNPLLSQPRFRPLFVQPPAPAAEAPSAPVAPVATVTNDFPAMNYCDWKKKNTPADPC